MRSDREDGGAAHRRRSPARRGHAAVLLAVLLASAGACASGDGGHVVSGRTMGTYYAVTLARPPAAAALPAIEGCIAAALARVDALMSTWRDDSELVAFNASRGVGWYALSPPTVAVLAEALSVAALSGGALDPTVAPLMALWGFGPRGDPGAALPAAEPIARTRERVGYRLLEVDRVAPSVRKLRADVEVDLSAVAKGYAVDVLAVYLEHRGLGGYLVDVGGEARASGERPGGGAWRVGLERAAQGAPGVRRIVLLMRAALATSGTYRRFRESAGRTLPDTVDPRTGAPVTHDLRAVSVVASSAARADALATALLVLGPEAGPRLAREHDIAAAFAAAEGETLSPAFAALARHNEGIALPPPDDAAARALLDAVGCGD